MRRWFRGGYHGGKAARPIPRPVGPGASVNVPTARIVYVVGRVHVDGMQGEPAAWQVLGVFDDHDRAVAACSTSDDFVGPIQLNRRLPDDVVPWPNAVYPLAAST